MFGPGCAWAQAFAQSQLKWREQATRREEKERECNGCFVEPDQPRIAENVVQPSKLNRQIQK